ncbi:MAG: hypothetical protein ABR600_13655 [Actinomycetota bacterium]
MPRSRVPLLVAPIALALLLGACGGGGSSADGTPQPSRTSATSAVPTPSLSPLPKCKLPKRIDFPSWVPKDLPLPEGTYASRRLPKTVGYFRGLFVLTVNTTDFAKYVLKEWPAAGWQLGRGDAEPGEIEDQFIKSPAFGAFKAQDMLCSTPHAIMLLIYVPDRSKLPGVLPATPTPGASGTPLSTATPTPSPS